MQADKITLGGLVVVEGRDDKFIVQQLITDPIHMLHGYSGVSKEKLKKLKELSKKYKLILILDPDFAGKKMRNIIKSQILDVDEIFIPRIEATKKDNIGIENVKIDNLKKAFDKYIKSREIKEIKQSYTYTINDLLDNNLLGNDDARKRREQLGDILYIGYYNSKQLLKVLNSYKIEYEDFKRAINKIDNKNNVGLIFGKFCPPHKGHINFIKEASKQVEELIVFLCVEKMRDDNLINNSTLPKKITIKDRFNILNYELSSISNIKILILNEEGIEYYPNGWEDWSNLVKIELAKYNKKANVIFTNEIQDIEEYKKYFDCNVKYFDLKRDKFNVSSTKIRNEYEKYKQYLTEYTVNLLEGK